MRDVYVFSHLTDNSKYGVKTVAATRQGALDVLQHDIAQRGLKLTDKSREALGKFLEGEGEEIEVWAFNPKANVKYFSAITYIGFIQKSTMVEK